MKAKDAGEARLVSLCEDSLSAGEPKVDGDRVLVHVGQGELFFSSSTGKPARKSAILVPDFQRFKDSPSRWVFDGELCEQKYHLFDLIEAGDLVSPADSFADRRDTLEKCFALWKPSPRVLLLPSYTDHYDKALLAKTVMQEGGEGLMFKRLDARYQPGKRSNAFLKVKFRKDVDCVVTAIGRDGKDNMTLSVYRDGSLVEVGECTRLAGDGQKVQVGDVVCVRILYVSKDFRLTQPTLPKIRRDKNAVECTWDQLPPLVVNKTVYS